MSLRDWGRFLLALVFPEHCPLCDALTPGGGLCGQCADRNLEPGEPRVLPGSGGCLCYAPFRYAGAVRRAVLRFKFRGRRDYAPWFGRQIARELRGRIDPAGAVLAPVPISRRRLRERGYNQSLLLARAAAEELGLPCVDLLEKYAENETQHTLSRSQRERNVRHVYRVKKGKAMQKEIILLDDIVTTGFTLAACVSALEQAGLRVRCCAALAANPHRREKTGEESGNP